MREQFMELVKKHGGTATFSGKQHTMFITKMDQLKAIRFHKEWESTHPGVSLPFKVVFQAERHVRYKSKGRVKHGTARTSNAVQES